jgi:hypothetical protein
MKSETNSNEENPKEPQTAIPPDAAQGSPRVEISDLGFVSNFDIRYSNFFTSCGLLGAESRRLTAC